MRKGKNKMLKMLSVFAARACESYTVRNSKTVKQGHTNKSSATRTLCALRA